MTTWAIRYTEALARWELCIIEEERLAMSKRRHRSRHLPVRAVRHDDGRLVLEVGGVVQSVYVPSGAGAGAELPGVANAGAGGYWEAMLPERCPRRALLLGLGGGTVARLLAGRCPGAALVGIERDEAVVATARAELGLDDVAGLDVVVADAFVWVPEAAAREPGAYDYICLDLFDGGRLAQGALATPFLRQVAALLAPEGTAAVNLMVTARTADQLHRLRRVYDVRRTVRVRGNLVAHVQPRADDARPPDAVAAPGA